MDAYVKRPTETVRVEFDLRAFAASVSPSIVTYTIRADAGPTIVDGSTVVGLVVLLVSGGRVGRVYRVSVEATTADGQSTTQVRRIRMREPNLPPVLSLVGTQAWDAGAAWDGGITWS